MENGPCAQFWAPQIACKPRSKSFKGWEPILTAKKRLQNINVSEIFMRVFVPISIVFSDLQWSDPLEGGT